MIQKKPLWVHQTHTGLCVIYYGTLSISTPIQKGKKNLMPAVQLIKKSRHLLVRGLDLSRNNTLYELASHELFAIRKF